MALRQTHQHAQAGDSPNVVPVSSLYERVDGHFGHVRGDGAEPASPQAMFRTYQKPPRRKKDNPDLILCAVDGCGAFPSKKFAPYCSGHALSFGLRKASGGPVDGNTD